MRKGLSCSEAGKLGAKKSLATQKRKKLERIREYELKPTICNNCNSPFPYEKRHNKFCNRSCAATYNNKGIQRWGSPANNCISCNSQTRNQKYCSMKCQHTYQRTYQRKIAIENKTASSRTSKAYLLETKGHKCWHCGIEEWNGKPAPLELEHIDGNSRNNDLSNLSILCCNCHAQTPTYKGANRGNGRHQRRQRYLEGKSY